MHETWHLAPRLTFSFDRVRQTQATLPHPCHGSIDSCPPARRSCNSHSDLSDMSCLGTGPYINHRNVTHLHSFYSF